MGVQWFKGVVSDDFGGDEVVVMMILAPEIKVASSKCKRRGVIDTEGGNRKK